MLTLKENFTFMLRKLYSDNGYKLFRMSRFEEYDFYADKKDFLSSKSILTFTNPDGRLMALRPDVTLSLIKHAGNGKFHYNENVYRVPRTSSSFREISQSGVEIIGNVNADDVTGLLRLALSSLEIIAGEKDYILVMADAGQILEILGENFNPQIIECISGKNIHGLKELNVSKKLIELCGLNGNAENSLPFLRNDTADIIRKLPQKHLRVDFSVADNLRYYNGIVFKGFIDGVPEAVISGGEYNIMGVKGAGFAVYLDFTGKYHD